MHKNFSRCFAAGMIASAALCVQAQANHLIFSEIGTRPPTQTGDASSEYAEIYNPTDVAIPLDNYYMSDKNVYSDLPFSVTGLLSGATTDHILNFPSGTTLLPGQVAVVCGGGTNFLNDFFQGDITNYNNLPGAPLLFEVGQTNGDVPDMISLNNHADRSLNFSYTDPGSTNGEFAVLFYWDGVSEAVLDVDIVTWGLMDPATANTFEPKTPPFYKADAGTHAAMSVSTDAKALIRTTDVETGEVSTGGNGITGHDETTEDTPGTWISILRLFDGDISDMTPGITSMTLSNTNVPPAINSVLRDKTNPTSAEQFTITANVTDPDGTVATVKIFVAEDGGSYTEPTVTANGADYSVTVGSYDNLTTVTYYVEAVDEDGDTSVYPSGGANAPLSVSIDNDIATSDDLVINEILYDRLGTDSDEWFEIYNRSTEPKSLNGFIYYESSGNIFNFPSDAVIDANGFVLLTFRPINLAADYPEIPVGTPVYQYPSGLDNPGDSLTLKGPNGLVDYVKYSKFAPWPEIDGNNTGRSLELTSPELDNSDPANWVGSPPVFDEQDPPAPKMGGSPGRHNSTLSNVSDWAIY